MHRSGTSAVTGALGGLGLQMPRPDDRMSWEESNPEHWESLSLGVHDEALLHGLGGSWDAPPDLPRHWLHTVAVLGGNRSAALLAAAFPEAGPAVFKDPRLCLLLPHWRTVLPDPVAALLVWREPLDVAHSLEQRDGLPLASGLALWERYNRSAIAGLAQVDTAVVRYEDVVADPAGALASWATWLGALAPFAPYRAGWDTARAADVISPDLRHQATSLAPEGQTLLSLEQRRLADRLHDLAGTHGPLPPVELGDETPWTTALLAARREATRDRVLAAESRQRFWTTRAFWAESRGEAVRAAAEATGARDRMAAERDGAREALTGAHAALAEAQAQLAVAQAQLADVYRSTSWKATQPLRSSVAKLEQWGRRSTGSGPGR
jgi:hypothetical protein